MDPNDTTNIGENWDYSIASADIGSYMTATQREAMKKNPKGWMEIEVNGQKSEAFKDKTPLPVIDDEKFAPDNSVTKENFTDKMSEALGLGKGKEATVSIPFENEKTGFHYETVIKRDHIDDFLEHITEGTKGKQHRERLLPMFLKTLKDPAEILEFCDKFRASDKITPIVVVPTSFNSVTESELAAHGVNICIYANQLTRAAFPAMQSVAQDLLRYHRAQEVDSRLMPFKKIITLINA